MAYVTGTTILAADYNNLIGTGVPNIAANQFNTVWGVGFADRGWGQPITLTSLSSQTPVSAALWATMIGQLNVANAHIGGTSVTQPISGNLIAAFANVSTGMNYIYSFSSNAATMGATVIGANAYTVFTDAQATGPFYHAVQRTATFGNTEQARWFFNAGGYFNINLFPVNLDSTARSADIVTLLGTNINSYPYFRATSGGGRTGSGGTVNANVTTTGGGYYNLTSTNVALVDITSTTSTYLGDNANILVRYTGTTGTNGDKSPQITFSVAFKSAIKTAPLFNESLSVNVITRIDTVYPETTNLANVWGAVTIG